MFRRIWEECVFPEEWGLSDVSPIHEEGKARDADLHCRHGTNCRFRHLDTGATP